MFPKKPDWKVITIVGTTLSLGTVIFGGCVYRFRSKYKQLYRSK